MRFADFEALVRRLAAEVPEEYLDGVAEVEVSRRTVPHPERDDIWTLGECIPLPAVDADPEAIQSRVVLYYGSFQALSGTDPGFDWREETWETLTHELRHHLEWRARAPDLEDLDAAAEANFARQDGEPFDPLFHLSGLPAGDHQYRIDHDVFVDRVVAGRRPPATLRFRWSGHALTIEWPTGGHLPAFLSVDGVPDPPEGDLVVVVRTRPGLRDLFRRRAPPPFQARVTARDDSGGSP